MHDRARLRAMLLIDATCLILAACGGAPGRPRAAGSPPADAVRRLTVPPSPYQIIYNPPVSLAKSPDTTAHQPRRRR